MYVCGLEKCGSEFKYYKFFGVIRNNCDLNNKGVRPNDNLLLLACSVLKRQKGHCNHQQRTGKPEMKYTKRSGYMNKISPHNTDENIILALAKSSQNYRLSIFYGIPDYGYLSD